MLKIGIGNPKWSKISKPNFAGPVWSRHRSGETAKSWHAEHRDCVIVTMDWTAKAKGCLGSGCSVWYIM